MIEPVRNALRLASLLLLFSVGSVNAQPRSSTDIALQFILGNCFHPLDDISRVKSAARQFKWDTLSAATLNMLKPVDATDYEAWHASFEGQHFFIGVNRGMFKGRPTEVCSVVVNQRPDVLLPRILSELKARKLDESAGALQVTEIYSIEHPTQSNVIMNVLRAKDGREPVNIGFASVR